MIDNHPTIAHQASWKSFVMLFFISLYNLLELSDSSIYFLS